MDTNVNDAGLANLKDMVGLRRLWLGLTKVTDAGLANIRRLSQLEWLELDKTQITDVGLASLKELSRLQYLGLSNTQVTDAGLAESRCSKVPFSWGLSGLRSRARASRNFEVATDLPSCVRPGNGPIVQPPLVPSNTCFHRTEKLMCETRLYCRAEFRGRRNSLQMADEQGHRYDYHETDERQVDRPKAARSRVVRRSPRRPSSLL